MRRSKVLAPNSSVVLGEESPTKEGRSVMHISSFWANSDITENYEHKVCMLGSSIEYYKLDCRDKIFPIKIEFKQVKNCFRFFASFTHMFPSEESNEYDFPVEGSCRRTITPLAKHREVEGFYICLLARNGVGMMSMRFNFYDRMITELKQEPEKSTVRIRKVKETPILSRTHSFLSRNNFRFRELTAEDETRKHKLQTATSEERISRKTQSTHRTNFLEKNIM